MRQCNDRFAETEDEAADYDIIECADFDEAIEIAPKHVAAKPRAKFESNSTCGWNRMTQGDKEN